MGKLARFIHYYTEDNYGGNRPDPFNTFKGQIIRFMAKEAKPIKNITAPFAPIQSLNGQEAPYPPGGGKNLIAYPYTDSSKTASGVTFTVNSDGSVRVVSAGTGTSTAFFNFSTSDHPTHLKAGTYVLQGNSQYISIVAKVVPNDGFINANQGVPKSGTLAEDSDCFIYLSCNSTVAYDVTIYPMIEVGSSASSWVPYSNICPITGWTEGEVTRTGKNLWSFDNITSKTIYRANVAKIGDDPNAFYLGGADGNRDNMQLGVNSWAYVVPFTGMRFPVDTSITVSCKVKNYTENCNGYVYLKYNDTEARSGATSVQRVYFNNLGTTEISITGTIPAGKYAFVEMTPASKSSSVTLEQYAEVTDFQIEIGSTKTDFEPYSGTTLTIPFNATYYGGHVDIFEDGSADVVVEKPDALDLGEQSWTYDSGTGVFYSYAIYSTGAFPSGSSIAGDILCESYKTVSYNTLLSSSSPCIALRTVDKSIRIKDPAYSDADTFTAAVAGVKLVYELAEPVTVHLTSVTMLNTLVGENIVFSDLNGDLTVQAYGTAIT